MDPQTLERLMIDRSLGVVGPDVERLIEAALKADPSSARLAEEYAEAVRLARLVVREGAPARTLPRLRAWGLARTAASRWRWAALAGAGAVAAAVLIGLAAGHVVSQAWRPAGRSSQARPAEARAVRHAGLEAALPGQQPRDGEAGAFQRNDGPAGDFWSARRLYLQASGGAAGRAPVVWTSPARRPGVQQRRPDMKANLVAVVIGLAGLGLVGCLPEERILWAPDGSKALVLSGDRLFLTDPAGKLTAAGEGIAAANWMKDSRRLVVARKVSLLTWQDATAVLPESRQAEIADLSAELRADLLAYEGDWDKYQLMDFPPEHGGDLALVLLYLRDHYGPELSRKLGERWKQVSEADVEVLHLSICPAEASSAMGPTLALALSCASPQASPDGKAIAYWGRPVEKAMAENALMVVAAGGAGGTQRVVAERTAAWAAWSADGRYLAYSAANLPKAGGDDSVLRLGTVSRSMIFDEKGDMLPEEKGFTREDLAGVLFHEEGKVACLPDGRILFSGASVELPATSADMPQQMSLFTVTPGGPSVVKALSRQEQGQLVDPLMCFAVSPGGTRVAIQGNTGQVAVVSLVDGTVRVIEAPPAGGKAASRIVPAWRSDDELSFVAPADSAGTDRAEVVLAKLTAERVTRTTLSQDWPQAARLGLLEEPPAASQPASEAQPPGTASQPASAASPAPTTGPTTRK